MDFLYLIGGIIIILMIINIIRGILSWFNLSSWESGSHPDPNATIVSFDSKQVQYSKNNAKLKNTIRFSDGFEYVIHYNDRDEGFLSYKIYLSPESKAYVIEKAVKAHDKAVNRKTKGQAPQRSAPAVCDTAAAPQASQQVVDLRELLKAQVKNEANKDTAPNSVPENTEEKTPRYVMCQEKKTTEDGQRFLYKFSRYDADFTRSCIQASLDQATLIKGIYILKKDGSEYNCEKELLKAHRQTAQCAPLMEAFVEVRLDVISDKLRYQLTLHPGSNIFCMDTGGKESEEKVTGVLDRIVHRALQN